MVTNEQRSQINQALAKAIAYKNCGKDYDANVWASTLLDLLHCNYIDAQSRFVDLPKIADRTAIHSH